MICPKCNGRGFALLSDGNCGLDSYNCSACNGTGKIKDDNTKKKIQLSTEEEAEFDRALGRI